MRDTKALHPALQKKIKKLVKLCEAQGLKIGISECLRTTAEQDALYAKGRTAPGSIVTNAKGSSYSSMHQWGVAFDFYRNDGTGAYNDSDGFFTKVGKLGQSIGLEWGGAWKSIVDKPHLQLATWGSTPTTLKQKYKAPDAFFKTWKTPKADYYPKYSGNTSSIVTALNAVGEADTSKNHRKQIAAANGIANYSGTAAQNTTLLNLLKKGKLLRPV